MSEDEFNRMIDSYIDRTAQGYGDVPGEYFMDLLLKRIEAKVDEVVNLSIDVGQNDELNITPDRELGDILIRGNEIIVGNRRFVLRLTEHV